MRTYDKQFVKQLQEPDRLAQKRLFEELYAPMFRVCQRYIVQTDEAEDCLMKGFLKVFQQIGSFDNRHEHSLFWWVKKIMVNECLTMLRRKHNFYMVAEENMPDQAVEADVWQKLHGEDLQQLIMSLPAGYRTVFSLHVVEGYEHKEVAEMLGITESTSKTQLLKAKGKLRQMLDQINYHYGSTGR